MIRKASLLAGMTLAALFLLAGDGLTLSQERWTDDTPVGVFFNNYDPNFYTGFAPRVQERERIKIHLGRGNQTRVRLVLSDAAIENYLPDQAARHDLYEEIIDKKIIALTSNRAWEAYHDEVMREGLGELARNRGTMSPEAWRRLNLDFMGKLNPGRLFHIHKDFNKMADDFARSLRNAEEPTTLEAKLDLINAFFPHRIFLYDLTGEQDADFAELVALARSEAGGAFRTKALAFFHSVTDNIYPVREGILDYYEITAIYPTGTIDSTTTYKGRTIPLYTTTGVWPLIPRRHGKGFLGMVQGKFVLRTIVSTCGGLYF
ncbi:hypothetical protein ACFL0Q_06245, partial [Thermodesulfobacteriota bacterium]